MSSTLNVTTSLVGNQYQVTGSLASGASLPPAVFLYQNTGGTTLGNYVGVAGIAELTRFQVFNGTAIPIFGNMYVLAPTISSLLPVGADPKVFISNTVTDLETLSKAYQTLKSVTQQYLIP